MTIPSFTRPTGNESPGELAEMVAKLQKQVEFLMTGNLTSKNVREIGGWLVDDDRFASADGDVGISTADTAGDDTRYWAGSTDKDAAPWRVTKGGKMHATGATIESSAGYPKIVMDPTGQLFAAYTSADTYVGITPDYLGNGPGQIAVKGGTTIGGTYSTSSDYNIVAAGLADLKLTSGQDIKLDPGGATGVIFSNWSRVYSSGALSGLGQNLQSALDSKSNVGHNHNSSYGSSLVYNPTSKLLKLFAPDGTLLSTADLT